METQSKDPTHRRQRGNHSSGRSRGRQGNPTPQENPASPGRNRSRRRKRSGNRADQTPKQTTAQKILSLLTFGLLGKPAAAQRSKSKSRSESARHPMTTASKPSPPRTSGEVSRKPKRNRSEVTSARLYVGNLDYATGEMELEELFRGAGNVIRAEVVTNPRTQQSKGFAFVEMGSIDEAKRAVSILDDQEFMGRKLIVSGARSEGPTDETGESTMAGSSLEERG